MDTDYMELDLRKTSRLEWTRHKKNWPAAIESGNAEAQVEANKRIATLAFENAKLEQIQEKQT